MKHIQVDPVGTFACRAGSNLHLQLRLPRQRELLAPKLRLRHRRTDEVIETGATVQPSGTGQLLIADIPQAQLEHGLWWVALKPNEDAPYRRTQARLLLNDKQPIALLAGGMPETRMAPPTPRAQRRRTQRKVHQRAVATVDRVLRRLPDERASRYRSHLAGLARRIRI